MITKQIVYLFKIGQTKNQFYKDDYKTLVLF